MEVNVAIGDIVSFEAGAIIVEAYEGAGTPEGDAARVDAAMGGAISQSMAQGEVKGKPGEVTILHSLGKLPATRVAVVGLGKKSDLNPEKVRSAVAAACRTLQKKNVSTAAAAPLGAGAAGIDEAVAARAIAEGGLLGMYSFRKHFTGPQEDGELKQLTLLSADSTSSSRLDAGVRLGTVLAAATNLARDMVNEPSNYMTPLAMADIAREVARAHGLDLTVLDEDQAREMGMGAFLGVAQGSRQPPKFIALRYDGRGDSGNDIALVGKGITFDSGGISLKPSEGMGEMKGDMAGGASVIGALGAIAELKPKLNVLGIVAATENLPGGAALKPGDVLKSMSGKTIEIISTDAEGRLTLADAISYARKQEAKVIVDVATLTGAMIVALGDICTGAFGNDQDIVNKVIAAGEQAGERIWQMPMFEEYKEQNKSDVADIKNTGGRPAGAITAAQFLAAFAGDTPWVHLDIAGTSMTEKERGYMVKGATGTPVRTLVNLVLALAML